MISIITATYNSAEYCATCIESVFRQDCPSEHILIDGGSTDGTLDIVQSYPHISQVISERDRGIYDAMNKGISLATNDVIGILNSDDFYAHEHVLTKVEEVFKDERIDTCYGDLWYVDNLDTSKITRRWISGHFNYRNFFWGWMPPHPTFFVRRSAYEKYGVFNLDMGSAADYELMLRFLVKHKVTTAYISDVLVKMRNGGASNASLKHRIKANRMDRKAWVVNGLRPYPWSTYLKPLRKIGQFFI